MTSASVVGQMTPSVAVAVLVGDTAALLDTLEAVSRQVYEPTRRFIVGGAAAARTAAEAAGVEWSPSAATLIEQLETRIDFVWFVRSGVVPRPDALKSLVLETERSGAAVAGSKLLRSDDPDELLSVGWATDVYGTTYIGLDDGEVDQGQYDVVRDVAAVPGTSLLIRRDLAHGIGGIDAKLAPAPAAIDLCQRARLRGARVVVVPSSEVLVPDDERITPLWRDEAGRIRAMLKSYSFLTLMWALPARMLIGLIEAVVAPLVGRWTLFAFVRAWLWNLLHLPSTFIARRASRVGTVVGDAELFRYQLRGSASLKSLSSELAGRFRERLPGDTTTSLLELTEELRRPAFLSGVLVILATIFGTRVIWRSGLPASGYLLPLPESATAALGSYAGGWNPAGFGGGPLPPLVGSSALVQLLLGDRAALAVAVLTIGAVLFGVWGAIRLFRSWDLRLGPAVAGGLVFVAGPASAALSRGTHWGAFVALGLVPWAIRGATTRWPDQWQRRLSHVSGLALIIGVLATFEPLLLPMALGGAILWIMFGDAGSWRTVVAAAISTLAGSLLILPWVVGANFAQYIDGSVFWEPNWALVGAGVAAGLVTLAFAEARPSRVAGWGLVMVGIGGLLARSADTGRPILATGLVIAALGSAAIVAAAFDAVAAGSGARRFVVGFGALGAAFLVMSTVWPMFPGRAGFPAVADSRLLELGSLGDAPVRALLFGPPDRLPGDERDIDGATYRVISVPEPGMWELWLSPPKAADLALEDVLKRLTGGETLRLGEELAGFGIGWVIVVGDSPFAPLLEGQLDLIRLGRADPTYRSEVETVARALGSDGATWTWEGAGYRGEPTDTVRLAENPDDRFGPEPWTTDGWANVVSGETGMTTYTADGSIRNAARIALVSGVLMMGLWLFGRVRS
ncbi:MAG: hypothetical protein HKN07_08295 [Acidimicrobiia bacterium]|nr:hypothetical protein [Acidimicrobiia bacterium]